MKYLIVVVGLSSSVLFSMEETDLAKDLSFENAVKINTEGEVESSPEPSPQIAHSDEKKSPAPSPTHAAQDTSAQKGESPKNPLPQISQIAHSDESTSPALSPTHIVPRATKTVPCYKKVWCFRRR